MSHATKPARLLAGAERPQLASMPALIILVYAAAVYLLFLAVLGYTVGFFAGLGVPKGIDQGTRAAVLCAGYAAGWAVAVRSTLLISHFDLFGLRQAWLHARRARYSPPPFTERGLYKRIRHPLLAGWSQRGEENDRRQAI